MALGQNGKLSAAESTLLIRADAGPQMGGGHVFRSLALGQAWMKRSGAVVFATAHMPARIARRVGAKGCTIEHLQVRAGTEDDLAATTELANRLGVSVIVIDGHHLGPLVESSARTAPVAAMLDFADRPKYAVDLIVNPQMWASAGEYTDRTGARLLLGTKFALLRSEFAPWVGQEREIKRVATNVMVTLGAGEQGTTLQAVLRSIASADIDMAIRAVIGPAADESVWQRSEFRAVDLRIDPDDMALEMSWADIAVTAGGHSIFEAFATGLPCIALPVTPGQRVDVASMAALGAPFVACTTPEKAGTVVTSLAEDEKARRRMSRSGQELVDGYGAERVTEALLVLKDDRDARRS